MAITGTPNEVLHRVRAKLYPNYLHGVEGAYIARTDDEASLSVEQVCAALKNRGGVPKGCAFWLGSLRFAQTPRNYLLEFCCKQNSQAVRHSRTAEDYVEHVKQFLDEACQKAAPFGLGVCA